MFFKLQGKKLFKLPPEMATKKEDAAELRVTIQKCVDSFQVTEIRKKGNKS